MHLHIPLTIFLFRLFLEEFQFFFVDKLFIGHTALLQYDLLDLLYCCFLFLFLLNSLVCRIDRLYGMHLICVLVAHICVSRYLTLFSAVIVSFLKRTEFYFVIGLLIIFVVRFVGFCMLFFICQFSK